MARYIDRALDGDYRRAPSRATRKGSRRSTATRGRHGTMLSWRSRAEHQDAVLADVENGLVPGSGSAQAFFELLLRHTDRGHVRRSSVGRQRRADRVEAARLSGPSVMSGARRSSASSTRGRARERRPEGRRRPRRARRRRRDRRARAHRRGARGGCARGRWAARPEHDDARRAQKRRTRLDVGAEGEQRAADLPLQPVGRVSPGSVSDADGERDRRLDRALPGPEHPLPAVELPEP